MLPSDISRILSAFGSSFKNLYYFRNMNIARSVTIFTLNIIMDILFMNIINIIMTLSTDIFRFDKFAPDSGYLSGFQSGSDQWFRMCRVTITVG